MGHAGFLSRLAGQHDQRSSVDPPTPTVLKLQLPVAARVPGDPAAGRHAYASGAVTQ